MPKIWDQAANETAELKRDMHVEFTSDGVLSESEDRLLEQADRAYGYTEGAGTLTRGFLRMMGGGSLDNSLMQQVRECEELLRTVRRLAVVRQVVPVRTRILVLRQRKNGSRTVEVRKSR